MVMSFTKLLYQSFILIHDTQKIIKGFINCIKIVNQ